MKFRIWNKSTKCFITENGHGLHNYSNWSIDIFTGKLVDYVGQVDGDTFIQEFAPDYYIDGLTVIKECPYIIQKYTGLKDKNGKEIYEGDILKDIEFPVTFNNGCFWVMIAYDFTSVPLYELELTEVEIIGNIFENPDFVSYTI